MSIIGQGAREAFKQQVLKKLDKKIIFYNDKARGSSREITRVIQVLERLRKEIEEMDTA